MDDSQRKREDHEKSCPTTQIPFRYHFWIRSCWWQFRRLEQDEASAYCHTEVSRHCSLPLRSRNFSVGVYNEMIVNHVVLRWIFVLELWIITPDSPRLFVAKLLNVSVIRSMEGENPSTSLHSFLLLYLKYHSTILLPFLYFYNNKVHKFKCPGPQI
jgi:hypothetical protein